MDEDIGMYIFMHPLKKTPLKIPSISPKNAILLCACIWWWHIFQNMFFLKPSSSITTRWIEIFSWWGFARLEANVGWRSHASAQMKWVIFRWSPSDWTKIQIAGIDKGIPPKNAPNISHQFAFSWQFLWLLWEKVFFSGPYFCFPGTFFGIKHRWPSPSAAKKYCSKIREVFYQSGWSDSNGSSSLRKFGMEFLAAFFGAQQKIQLFSSSRVSFNSTTFFQGPPFHP